MRLLVINANTNPEVTEYVARAARDAAAAGTEIRAVTSSFGARYIEARSDIAVAGHATLALAAERHAGCDAVLVAVSFDTGVSAARELLPMPVVGATEAALLTGCVLGGRCAQDRSGHNAQSTIHPPPKVREPSYVTLDY